MTKLVKIFFFLLLFIYITSCNGNAQEIYVSSSIGSDNNTGLKIDDPLKTISTAQKKGKNIYLKAGDIFYEYVGLNKQHLHRYGDGVNPEINGIRYIKKGQWKKQKENVWKLDLTSLESSGFVVSGSSELNNIGCFYEPEDDKIHGMRLYSLEKLNRDWDFYQCNTNDYTRDGSRCFDIVYLYYSGNPNDLNLAITVGSHCGLSLNDSSVENVNIKGFGSGGIDLIGTDTVINCRIDIIGGSMMLNSTENVCLGNGIGFWLYRTSSDCIIEDNYISRCYDCGCTIQGSGCGKATPLNIVFRNNLISHCCQGWEDFLRNDPDVKYENCRFDNNIVVFAGDSGFGYPESRKKRCNVLGNNYEGNKGMIISKNIFVGGNFYCSGSYNGMYHSNNWKDNIHYISRGSYILSNYIGTQDVLEIPRQGSPNSVISRYRKLTNDKSTSFIIKNEEDIDSLCIDYIKRFSATHSY